MGVTENLIENELGCGIFQIVLVAAVYWVPMVPTYFSIQMMSFGSYNPGWTCLDGADYIYTGNKSNNSVSGYIPTHYIGSVYINMSQYRIKYNISNINDTILDNDIWYPMGKNQNLSNQTLEHGSASDSYCIQFKKCNQVEFDSEASTIVTEWELLCDKAQIPPLIISLQMTGVFVGSLISGHIIDIFGRKKSFYCCLFLVSLVNFVSIFSNSWQMFAVLRCFQGFLCASLTFVNLVYSSEFLTRKWRAPLSGSPIWSISGILFGVTTMLLKDWRHFLVVTSVLTLICCLPVVWIPESLRWLEVKNKSKKFKDVANKIAKMNKKNTPLIDSIEFFTERKSETKTDFEGEENSTDSKSRAPSKKKFTFIDLFRPGYRLYSIIVAIQWFSMTVVITSITFGVKSFGGNFYINLMLMNAMSIPFSIFPVVAPNIIGRKRAIFTCFSLISICLITATMLDLFLSEGNVKNIGTLVSMMGVIAGVESGRAILILLITEIYPTVVRGLAVSWGSLVSRVGAIIAPFLIPTDSSNGVYIWYSILGFLGLVCCCLVALLPETKGKPLKETFDAVSDNCENNQLV